MAVQTEHAKTGSEFCTRGFAVAVANGNANAVPTTNHHRTSTTDQRLPACTALPGNCYCHNGDGNGGMNIMKKKICSEETPQRSELTYNACTPLAKKRTRENPQFMASFPYPPFSMELPTTQRPPIGAVPVMGSAQRSVKQARLMDSGFHPVATGSNFLRPLPVCGNAGVGVVPVPPVNAGFSTLRGAVTGTVNANQARLVGSGSPSTSGRAALSGLKSTGIDNELAAIFQQLAADTDNIFDLEVQKIRMAIDEERKAFYRAIMSDLARSPAMQWLAQKEAELEASARRNAELEHGLNQLSAENQTWMNIARNNESVVMKLRLKMEQSLKNGFDKNASEEGMGDTDEVESACRDNVPESRFSCRVCRKKDAERLIFPCRHLCICDGCDAVVSACPVCTEPKLSSIPVLFS